MKIRLIEVPYDSGSRNLRMGQGPFCFVENGVVNDLCNKGIEVQEVVIECQKTFLRESGTTFNLHRSISEQVRIAMSEKAFPLVLAGNCNSTVGAMSGLSSPDCGLIWFDAHGDFNTPETSTTGFLDGMGLAMLTGGCWNSMTASIPGFRPLSEDRVILIGARDFDKVEYTRLKESQITLITWEDIRTKGASKALENSLNTLANKVTDVYIHIDLDVHDTRLAPANLFKSAGGLTPKEVQDAVRIIAQRFSIPGAAVTAYDPDADPERKGLRAGLALITLLGEIGANQ